MPVVFPGFGADVNGLKTARVLKLFFQTDHMKATFRDLALAGGGLHRSL